MTSQPKGSGQSQDCRASQTDKEVALLLEFVNREAKALSNRSLPQPAIPIAVKKTIDKFVENAKFTDEATLNKLYPPEDALLKLVDQKLKLMEGEELQTFRGDTRLRKLLEEIYTLKLKSFRLGKEIFVLQKAVEQGEAALSDAVWEPTPKQYWI